MKTSPLLRGGALGAALLACAAFTPAAHAAEKVLVDFTDVRRDPGESRVIRCYEYTWGDFDGNHTEDRRRVGAIIRAPGGNGGLGENNTAVNFGGSPAVVFEYVVVPGNKADHLTFQLVDADGTDAQWNLPLDGKPNMLTSRRLDLTKPDYVSKPGKTPGVDAKHITEWHVNGDFQKNPLAAVLVKVKAAQ